MTKERRFHKLWNRLSFYHVYHSSTILPPAFPNLIPDEFPPSERSDCVIRRAENEKSPASFDVGDSYKKVAATYSPTWWGSTIGDGALNFSVRNGKRWILTAITATICF